MTEKLYETDSLLKACDAVVISCEPKDDHYEVVLDKTVIFPEGGGQLSDQGTIKGVPVYYASDAAGEVRHYTHSPLEAGQKVHVVLNWDLRLDRMQQHCGEHMLSYAFWKTCGANNVGFHMNEESVFIDLDQEIDEEKAAKAELFANQGIWENDPITVHQVQHTELDQYPLRKKNEKLRGTIRLVDIKNGDICTCCGTHPPYTGMVGVIKIIRFAKHKGGSRIEFLCGKRALAAMHQRNCILEETSNFLSVKTEEVLPAVQKLHQEIVDLKGALRSKNQELLELQLPALLAKAPVFGAGTRLLFMTLEGSSADGKNALKKLSSLENVLCCILVKDGARVMYQFAVSPGGSGDCKAYCQMANQLFGGRGGGKAQSAQGGGEAGEDWLDKAETLKQEILQAVQA